MFLFDKLHLCKLSVPIEVKVIIFLLNKYFDKYFVVTSNELIFKRDSRCEWNKNKDTWLLLVIYFIIPLRE